MECERMRVQSEAGPCCVAPRGGTEAFLLTDWRPDRLHRPHSARPASRIAFTHIRARLFFFLYEPSSLPAAPLIPFTLLLFTECRTLRPALPPSYAPPPLALISLSNTTFPDVCWLLHHRGSLTFRCCHLAFEVCACVRVCWPARGMLLPPLHSTLIAVYRQREGSSESGSRGVVCLLLDDIKRVLCEGRSQSSLNQSQVAFITILNMEFQPTNKTCFYFLAICLFYSSLQPAIARPTCLAFKKTHAAIRLILF